ncbi:hypothetical protein C0V97_14350 [Asaia sp. W19]|uniref:hypothetical protein n=1 Tax=unclassified Asaia TaxID=2685023 RepID=UPI000F8D592F|nr:hypothetical protein [Asaia sp. W19]RUT24897.1 hypothetical protein C0V97_14350 [Asaia sp. W19]
MPLPCHVRQVPLNASASEDDCFSWGLPDGLVGLIRGPKAQAYATEKGLKGDLSLPSSLEKIQSRTPISVCHGDLDLPGKLCSVEEVLPPCPYPKLGASDKERDAFRKAQRFSIAALAVENETDRLLAQAYLDLTGKSIPIIDLRGIDFTEKLAQARRALCGFMAQRLTKDAYIPRFQPQRLGESEAVGPEASRYYGAPFMPVSMDWPHWCYDGKIGPCLFHSQYRWADLPEPIRACLPAGIEAFLVFVNPIIEDWPRLPDNPPFTIRFVRKGEPRVLRPMPVSGDLEPPCGRKITAFCKTRDTGILMEYESRPDARAEDSDLVTALRWLGSDALMEADAAHSFLLRGEESAVPPASPLLNWEGDKFLGEPNWVQGADYQTTPDGAPMIAFLHIANDGVPNLKAPPEALSRYGAGIVWLPEQWRQDQSYESQIRMTWELG